MNTRNAQQDAGDDEAQEALAAAMAEAGRELHEAAGAELRAVFENRETPSERSARLTQQMTERTR